MTKKITTFITILLTVISFSGWHPAIAESPPVLITEVQTGFIDSSGVESPLHEFIELTSISQSAVNLTGWKLEYLSAANDGMGAPTQVIDTINGQISAGGNGIWEHDGYFPIAPDGIFGVGDVSTSGFLAKSGGHVRLMNGSIMVDCVSWGSAVAITGCDKVSAVASAGYTLQRQAVNGVYSKTSGVANVKPATPKGNNIYAVPVEPPLVIPPVDPEPEVPPAVCETIELSEIVANPAGDDVQGEYIELYNPSNQQQTLYGCSLHLSSGKQYSFKSTDSLAAGQYQAFMFTTTGLQLINGGATVTLVTVGGQANTTYPSLGDDEAWVSIGGVWSISDQATPNLANTPGSSVSTNTAELASVLVSELESCPVGKYRNPTTNRCRNIGALEDTPTVCQVGQERNPATGRCRKIATATIQAACQVGQERNPETGRCRKVDTVATSQKPCETGQERNAETGRCRKVTTPTAGKVLGANISKKAYHYILVGTILAAVLGYGLYEYRSNFVGLLNRLRRHKVSS